VGSETPRCRLTVRNRYRRFEFTSLRHTVGSVWLQPGDSGKFARGRADSLGSWQRRERPILQIANSPRFLSVQKRFGATSPDSEHRPGEQGAPERFEAEPNTGEQILSSTDAFIGPKPCSKLVPNSAKASSSGIEGSNLSRSASHIWTPPACTRVIADAIWNSRPARELAEAVASHGALQKIRERCPGISTQELHRHLRAAGFCVLCGESLTGTRSISDAWGRACYDCAQKNGMTF
jgi:hypothetical protein